MNKEKFKVIATKVSTFVKERIGRICKKRGLNEYEMLQMMCDCIVRYMDDRHNLTPEMERVMSIWMVGQMPSTWQTIQPSRTSARPSMS